MRYSVFNRTVRTRRASGGKARSGETKPDPLMELTECSRKDVSMSPQAAEVQTVTSVQVERLLATRETYQALKKRLDAMAETLNELETEIIAQIEEGMDFSRLGYHVRVQETVRRYPAWKEHFLSYVGKAEADAVLEATPPIIHKKLIVE